MSRDKQIMSDMQNLIWCRSGLDSDESAKVAGLMYDAGYRKASEVARAIFEEIENAIGYDFHSGEELRIVFALSKLNEVKRKHLNEDFFIKMTHTCPHIIPDLVTKISDTAFRHPLTELQYTSEQIRRNGVECRLRKGRK